MGGSCTYKHALKKSKIFVLFLKEGYKLSSKYNRKYPRMIYEMFVNNLRGQFGIYMCMFLCKLEDRKCNRYYLVKTYFCNQNFHNINVYNVLHI